MTNEGREVLVDVAGFGEALMVAEVGEEAVASSVEIALVKDLAGKCKSWSWRWRWLEEREKQMGKLEGKQ